MAMIHIVSYYFPWLFLSEFALVERKVILKEHFEKY